MQLYLKPGALQVVCPSKRYKHRYCRCVKRIRWSHTVKTTRTFAQVAASTFSLGPPRSAAEVHNRPPPPAPTLLQILNENRALLHHPIQSFVSLCTSTIARTPILGGVCALCTILQAHIVEGHQRTCSRSSMGPITRALHLSTIVSLC